MRTRVWLTMMLTGSLVLCASSTAMGATQLGVTVAPTSAAPLGCPSAVVVVQSTDDPATPYIVPAGGFITAWDTKRPARHRAHR
jgi:hypothetical protein